jgi:hypothetical protein
LERPRPFFKERTRSQSAALRGRLKRHIEWPQVPGRPVTKRGPSGPIETGRFPADMPIGLCHKARPFWADCGVTRRKLNALATALARNGYCYFAGGKGNCRPFGVDHWVTRRQLIALETTFAGQRLRLLCRRQRQLSALRGRSRDYSPGVRRFGDGVGRRQLLLLCRRQRQLSRRSSLLWKSSRFFVLNVKNNHLGLSLSYREPHLLRRTR